MNLKTIGKIGAKIGAGLLGGAALIIAGKSGFGENLFSSKDEVDTNDLENALTPAPEPEVETPTEVDETTAQEEVSE